jgi:hypothetical protein
MHLWAHVHLLLLLHCFLIVLLVCLAFMIFPYVKWIRNCPYRPERTHWSVVFIKHVGVSADQALVLFGKFRLFLLQTYLIAFISLRSGLNCILFRLQFPYHDLWYSTYIFHRRVDLPLLCPEPELMIKSGRIHRVWGDTAVSQQSVPKLLFHELFVHFPLRSFGFSVNGVPIGMVLELENFWAETLVLLIGEVSEQFMGRELILIKLCDNYRVLLHFSQECADSFIVIVQ